MNRILVRRMIVCLALILLAACVIFALLVNPRS